MELVLKPFHLKEVSEYDFSETLKEKIQILKDKCNFDDKLFNVLVDMCDKYFEENIFGLIHGDLHFDNFIFDGTNLHLLDFERCMIAPIDYDFRIFARYDSEPYLWASAKTDMITVEYDYKDLMGMFLENYQELNEIPYINERLEIYSIIELLENYKNTKSAERMQEISEKIRRLKSIESKIIK